MSAAVPAVFVEALASLIGGMLLALVVWAWHRGRKFFNRAESVLTAIALFGEQWTSAAALAGTITATDADVEALKAQLGTADRDPEWVALEAYLHAWRHDQRNANVELRLMVEAMQKIAGQMTGVSEQMVKVAAMVGGSVDRDDA